MFADNSSLGFYLVYKVATQIRSSNLVCLFQKGKVLKVVVPFAFLDLFESKKLLGQ